MILQVFVHLEFQFVLLEKWMRTGMFVYYTSFFVRVMSYI